MPKRSRYKNYIPMTAYLTETQLEALRYLLTRDGVPISGNVRMAVKGYLLAQNLPSAMEKEVNLDLGIGEVN